MEGVYRQAGEAPTEVVRSIRIAVALNERVGELLKPRRYSSDEQLGNVLGELRQVFPEVWSNLDDAREGLAKRGIAVEAYDALRASKAAHSGGVLGVEVSGNRGLGGWEKEAHLNHAGHAAASEACNVLRAALPNVDWEALDRADEAELAAAGSLKPARWKMLLFYGIMGVIALVAAVGLIYFKVNVRRH